MKPWLITSPFVNPEESICASLLPLFQQALALQKNGERNILVYYNSLGRTMKDRSNMFSCCARPSPKKVSMFFMVVKFRVGTILRNLAVFEVCHWKYYVIFLIGDLFCNLLGGEPSPVEIGRTRSLSAHGGPRAFKSNSTHTRFNSPSET